MVHFNPAPSHIRPVVFLAGVFSIVAIILTGYPASTSNAGNSASSSIVSAVSERPTSPAAISLVVNDTGDAEDTNIGDSICDTSPTAGEQCTLRASIQETNAVAGDDTVTFSTNLNGSIITLNTALPDISGNLILVGPRADLLRVQRNTAVGTASFRIFTIGGSLTVRISGLTVSNGRTPSGADGGAIFNQSNTLLTLTGIKLIGNATADAGLFRAGFGGAIFNRGTINLIGSTVSGNVTGRGTFGGPSKGGNGAGIYNNTGAVLNVINSTISGNATGNGFFSGSLNDTDGDGGGILNAGTANLTNVTISSNATSNGTSGSPGGRGAGINNAIGGTLTLSNCTVTGNIASNGIGGSIGGGIAGGGTLRNTIIANNRAVNGPDLSGSFNSQNHNLIENTTGASFTGTTTNNITGQDPILGPLADNGGPTQTHSLLASSPALDAGSNSNLPVDTFDLDGDSNTAETLPLDQRGEGFIRVKDGPDADTLDTVDIGALEAQASIFLSFSQSNYTVGESGGFTTITVNRTNDTSGAVSVDYATSNDSTTTMVPCSTANGIASSRCDFTTALGTLRFAAGESSKTFTVLISQDNYVEGSEGLSLTLSNPTGGATFATPSTETLTITDDATEPATNPIDVADDFVRQHYHDFLNREADAGGLAFWSNQITECQQPGATCNAEERRINVSAAFFVSIEFQETGYLVYRIYKASYGNISGAPVPLRLNEFLPDTQQIGLGVVVGVGNWETQLENNKVAFAQEFVSRSRFTTAYPTTMTPAQFVDALFINEGVTPSTTDRDAAISEFAGAVNTADTATRARALRRIAENSTFKQQEFNRAFVLMQYFGYLRRNPNDAPEPGLNFDGYNFWLGKLNQFNGNYINAEMVKAFITAGEYRQRFGP